MSWRADARPGEPALSRFTKWPGLEHWQREGVWLGTDEHGDWVGRPVGSRSWRPGADYLNPRPSVLLAPHAGTDWVASFGLPADPVPVYVDLMWDVAWSPTERGVLTGIDMDLDVVRTADRTYLDDEDEFAEHSARWRYPDDVRARVGATAERLLTDVRERVGPFDEATADRWLARLAALG